jgi:hypothetical protein
VNAIHHRKPRGICRGARFGFPELTKCRPVAARWRGTVQTPHRRRQLAPESIYEGCADAVSPPKARGPVVGGARLRAGLQRTRAVASSTATLIDQSRSKGRWTTTGLEQSGRRCSKDGSEHPMLRNGRFAAGERSRRMAGCKWRGQKACVRVDRITSEVTPLFQKRAD